jgi:hypothetical protein
VKCEHRDFALAKRIAERGPYRASLATVAERDCLIDFLKHGVNRRRLRPEQYPTVSERLDDLSCPLKLCLRTLGEANVDALDEIDPGQFLDDVLHGGRGKIAKQSRDNYPDRHTSCGAQNIFLHLSKVLIDQACEGRDNILLEISHVSA